MRIVPIAERESGDEVESPESSNGRVQYVNRDHVITACIEGDHASLQLTNGREITLSGSATELSELIEALTASAQSNFVQISSAAHYTNLS